MTKFIRDPFTSKTFTLKDWEVEKQRRKEQMAREYHESYGDTAESKIHRMELGRYRTWITRLGGYLAPVNFTILLYVFITNDPLGVSWNVWLVSVLVAVPCLMIFDILVIYPSELRYAYDKNKRMKRLEEKIDQLLQGSKTS